MESRPLSYVCAAWGGEVRHGSPDTFVRRVCTDSRQARAGDLFFALRGERFDGHDFLAEVAAKKAAALVVDHARMPPGELGCAVLPAPDAKQALGQLAGRYRNDFDLPVIAVCGSNGKTTVKELLASVLRRKFETLWSEASFNNDIGVPLTLLNLERRHGAAVLEAGTNHPGELAPLLRLIRPQVGVLTSLGREHLEFFGDIAGVVEEEGWLAESLPPDGKLIVNGDSEWIEPILRRTRAQVVRVGFGRENHWRMGEVMPDENGVAFEVSAPQPEFTGSYRVSLLGRHQALNGLLALAAGAEMGLDREQVSTGLANCKPPKMRLQIWEANGLRVLDDSYNANADSALAALQTLRDLPTHGRRLAVLGDMAELGQHSAAAHTEIGRRAAELNIHHLLAVGRWAPQTAAGARAGGLDGVSEYADVAEAAAALRRIAVPGDLVLLKASRAVGLERLADILRAAS